MNSSIPNKKTEKRSGLSIREMAVFAMLGALMFCSKVVMQALPNIHLLGMFTMVFTLTFRKKALIPIYLYVMLEGLFYGFNAWWVPYLYVWTILWGVTMLLPKSPKNRVAYVLYPAVCCLHGIAFGTLFAPGFALLTGMDLSGTLAWIAAGFPWDVVHGIGNLFSGILVLPLSRLLKKLTRTL